jgi:DNA-binding NarL/FixJ family response regulator
LEAVGEADSITQAIGMKLEPILVLLSAEGPENSNLAAIGSVKARWPEVHCIVLVDTVAEQRAAMAAGAEEAMVKGVRPEDLLGRIERLLHFKTESTSENELLDG